MYQIVLTENRVKVKVRHEYIRKRDALYRFNKINSTKVFMPKETVYKDKKLIKVTYEILLIKQKEHGEENVTVVDELGRNKQIKTDLGDWVVLDKIPFVILNNKVVIEGLGLYMVTCKNVEQATRLYNLLRVHCYDNSVGHVIFFGTVPKDNKKVWYKKINERTGVSYNRLYRSSSR